MLLSSTQHARVMGCVSCEISKSVSNSYTKNYTAEDLREKHHCAASVPQHDSTESQRTEARVVRQRWVCDTIEMKKPNVGFFWQDFFGLCSERRHEEPI